MSAFSIDLLIQPALVAGLVFTKDVLYDGYIPESMHVWLDVASNVAAKFVSQFITSEFIIPSVGQMALAIEPVLHGGINGAVKSTMIDTDQIRSLGAFTTGVATVGGRQRRVTPPLAHYTFENGFLEGAGYNAVSVGGGLAIDKFVSML
jgi:hypothetical protein